MNARSGFPALDLEIVYSGKRGRVALLPNSEKAASRLHPDPIALGFRTPGALYMIPAGNGVEFDRVPPGFTLPVQGGSTIDAQLQVARVQAEPGCAIRLFAYDEAGANCGRYNLSLQSEKPRAIDLPPSARQVAVALRLEGEGRIAGLTLRLDERRSFAALLGDLAPTIPVQEARALIADLAPDELEGEGQEGQILGIASRLIAQGDRAAAIGLLIGRDARNARARKLLMRALDEAGADEAAAMLFRDADEQVRADPVFRLRALQSFMRRGAVRDAATLIEESLFAPGGAAFIARAYASGVPLPEPLGTIVRARIVEDFDKGRLDFIRVLPAAHDLIATDPRAFARVLATVADGNGSGETRLRLDLLAAQAAFRRGDYPRQLAWINAALARQGLDPVEAAGETAFGPGAARVAPVAAVSGPPVTVIIVAQDDAASIEGSVRSMLAQSHRDLDLIVVDRGSLDETAARAEAAFAGDPRARVVAAPRGIGHWAAHDGAVGVARHVVAQPADGWAHPRAVERLLLAAVLQGSAAVLPQRLILSPEDGLLCHGDYLAPDPASLLYDRTLVQPIGVHDDVRWDGAIEFVGRIARGLGRGAVHVAPDILQIASPAPAAPAEARTLYRRRYLAWHDAARVPRLGSGDRPFDLPEGF